GRAGRRTAVRAAGGGRAAGPGGGPDVRLRGVGAATGSAGGAMTRERAASDSHRENRHAWLQKHPSPLTSGREVHWYPEGAHAGDRGLRAGLVERVRGIGPPAVLWQLERGRVAWGQVFAAPAPLDGRRYVGLVLSVVEGNRPAGDLLAALAPPPAAPWSGGLAVASPRRGPHAQEVAAVRHD